MPLLHRFKAVGGTLKNRLIKSTLLSIASTWNVPALNLFTKSTTAFWFQPAHLLISYRIEAACGGLQCSL